MVEKNKKTKKDPFNLVATKLKILKITKEILNLHLAIEKSWIIEIINDDEFYDITSLLNKMSRELL
jgi:hypothetical protein